jgi:hypothetical protein
LLLVFIVGGTFWKITLAGTEYTWLDSPDLANQVLPWLQYEASEIHHGNIPLWDPYEWAGQSLIGQAQPGIANPIGWPFLAMPLNSQGHMRLFWINGYFLTIHYLGALFCYLLCRDLGRSVLASVFGGAAFALGGWVGPTDWPQMISGGIWAPLVFLFFFRALRGVRPIRNGALAGAMLGLSVLSGHHQIPIFIGLAVGGCWIYYLAQGNWTDRGRWAAIAAFGIMAGLVGAIQILPASDYGHQALRWVGSNNPVKWNDVVPYRALEALSMLPAGVIGLVARSMTAGTEVYLGWAVVLTALAGIVAAWREPPVKILAIVAAAGMLGALGGLTVFHGIVYSLIPNVDKARRIEFAVFLLGFGAAVLSSYGVDRFLEAGAGFRRLASITAAAAGALALAATWFVMQTTLPRTNDYNLLAFEGILALLIAGTLAAWSAGRLRHPAVVIAILSLLELGSSIGYAYQRRDRPGSLLTRLSGDPELAAWLRHAPAPVRAQIDDQQIPYNFGDWYSVDVFGGYLASLSINVDSVRGFDWARNLLGVNYWVGRKPQRDDQTEVFRAPNGINVYRNKDAFPPVWTVHKVTQIDPAVMGQAFDRGGAYLRGEAFFTGAIPPPPQSCAGDTVTLLRREANSFDIDARMQCRGVVVAGDEDDDGWRAWVDGSSTPVYEAYGIARAVEVPAGHHLVEMRYRPTSVVAGAVMSAIGFIVMLGLLFV